MVSHAVSRLSANIFAGSALGGLLGLLLGSSTTPLVAGVMTGLVALLATFLGLSEQAGNRLRIASLFRIGAFACGMLAGAVTGLMARTHQWFAPSLADQIREAVSVEELPQGARDTVKLLRYGLAPAGSTPSDSPIVKNMSPGFYSTLSNSDCNQLRQVTGPARLDAMKRQVGTAAEFAARIENLPTEERKMLMLAAAPFYLCRVDAQ
ncbi:hypothetical protein [Bosea sp. LjRoot237]|uniref:hypothetical protein n=1 Tax=Bosea sp. LjRoot237 TaxID=3342292 RepID=UPI003ECF1146